MYRISLLIFFLFSNSIFSQSWQGSLDNNESVKLRIRDKYGERGYTATFIVKTKSVEYIKQIYISNSDWGTVEFPKDFPIANDKINLESPREYYEWQCTVNDKPVLYGNFYFPNFILKFYNQETKENISSQNLEKLDSKNLPTGKVTLSQYYRVETGMSYEQVIKILGHPYQEMSRSEFMGTISAIYVWKGNGFASNLQILFTDWKVTSKSQFGLE